MISRAHLVLTSASHSLANTWNDPQELERQLQGIARDERVMAVAACGTDLSTRSITAGFPQEFNCAEVGPRVRIPTRLPHKKSRFMSGIPSQRFPPAAFR